MSFAGLTRRDTWLLPRNINAPLNVETTNHTAINVAVPKISISSFAKHQLKQNTDYDYLDKTLRNMFCLSVAKDTNWTAENNIWIEQW